MFEKKKPEPILPEERVSLPSLEIAIVHSIKTVFMIDQTGTDPNTLMTLEAWVEAQGYFLHCVSVAAPTEAKNE